MEYAFYKMLFMLVTLQRKLFSSHAFKKYSDIKFHAISPNGIEDYAVRKIDKKVQIIL